MSRSTVGGWWKCAALALLWKKNYLYSVSNELPRVAMCQVFSETLQILPNVSPSLKPDVLMALDGNVACWFVFKTGFISFRVYIFQFSWTDTNRPPLTWASLCPHPHLWSFSQTCTFHYPYYMVRNYLPLAECLCSPKFMCWSLIPNVMVFGNGNSSD